MFKKQAYAEILSSFTQFLIAMCPTDDWILGQSNKVIGYNHQITKNSQFEPRYYHAKTPTPKLILSGFRHPGKHLKKPSVFLEGGE